MGGVAACNWGNEENNFQTFIKCFFLFFSDRKGAFYELRVREARNQGCHSNCTAMEKAG